MREIIRGSFGSLVQSAKNQQGHKELIVTSHRQRAIAAMSILGKVIASMSDRAA